MFLYWRVARGLSSDSLNKETCKHWCKMSNTYKYEYTDTFAGEANYCWVRRGKVTMPELTHYGHDGCTNFWKANKVMERELVKMVKAELGLTGVQCKREEYGDTIVLRPYGGFSIVFIDYCEE